MQMRKFVASLVKEQQEAGIWQKKMAKLIHKELM